MTRYYRNLLWKVTTKTVLDGRGRPLRFVKHYERRTQIGGTWVYVRGVAMELKQ